MKIRWLVATVVYAVACAGALFVPWIEGLEGGDERIRSEGDLLRGMIAVADVLDAVRLCWMIPVLTATAVLWASARRSIRPAHTELSIALAVAAIAYPFVSFPETRGLSTWVQSSAAAFVVVFSGVLGWRAFSLQRKELDLAEVRPLIRDS